MPASSGLLHVLMMIVPPFRTLPVTSTTPSSVSSSTMPMSAVSTWENIRMGSSEIRVEAVTGAPRRSGPKVGAEVTPLKPSR